jgi:hypothetical protein
MNVVSRLTSEPRFKVKTLHVTTGAFAVGLAIVVSSFTAARAEHAQPGKVKSVFTCSTGTACLEGSSTGNGVLAVYGVSTSGTAVLGLTSATNGSSAISGLSLGKSGSGNGVYGSSAEGDGVYGTTSYGNGVYGTSSDGAGVYGVSSGGSGVYGISNAAGAAGVAGYQLNTTANSGFGVYAESADATGQYPVIYAQGDGTATYLFTVQNIANKGGCGIDPYGIMVCTGFGDFKAVRTRHLTSSGQHVLAYAAESASATLDDVGMGRMVAGIATVPIDRAFGATIDRNDYHVFVTPRGDTRGLYVTAVTPAGFEVREAQGGRSTVDFDYRIVARPLDAKNDRLPVAPPFNFGKAPIRHRHAR